MRLHILLFAVLPILTAGHYHSGYFYQLADGFDEYKTWMSRLDDGIALHRLSIPGTHDSAAHSNAVSQYPSFVLNWMKNQCITFDEQIKFGIRAFDIRLCNEDGTFKLCHGPLNTNEKFNDFLLKVSLFLQQNPSEFIFARIKIERTRQGPESDDETFHKYVAVYRNLFLKIASFNETVGQARGKIILLTNEEGLKDYSHKYNDCDIQDYYDLNNRQNLYEKWEKVRDFFLAAPSKTKCKINYLSGSSASVTPWFVASGHSDSSTKANRMSTGSTSSSNKYPDFPRQSCFNGKQCIFYEGTNVLTTDWINDKKFGGNGGLGLVMADFPGTGLIKAVINTNF